MLKAIALLEVSGGTGSGVTSLQGETGAITLTSATLTITTPTGSTINLESSAGGGNVNTTGSPASGNLTKFSGATTITNGDLSGDVTTSGTLATTVAKVNGVTYPSSPSVNTVAVVTGGNAVTYIAVPNLALANSSVTISGHLLSLGGSLNLTSSDVGLGNVTNDTQTKAAIVPNTAPSAGQILIGNAGGTAYAPALISGDATVASTGVLTIGPNAITTIKIAANAVTNAKMATSSANTLAGYDNSGNFSGVTIGTGLSLSSGQLSSTVAGTVTTVSVATANGFAGTVANPTSTPAITIQTSITGLLKGNGTAVTAAVEGTDYAYPYVDSWNIARCSAL